MSSLYRQTGVIAKLRMLWEECFQGLTRPTTQKLIRIMLGLPPAGALRSVRSLYTEFLAQLSLLSLNSLYHALSYAKRPEKPAFLLVLARRASYRSSCSHSRVSSVWMIPSSRNLAKSSRMSALSSTTPRMMAVPSKSGHCLVCVMICVPVRAPRPGGRPVYISVLLKVKIWKKGGPSKLQIA